MTRGRRGCWTCRIRHRKCDESAPACKECSTRHITCHGYDLRAPEWMSDERRLQEELQRIKVAVKENFRRVKRAQNRRLAHATAQAALASRSSAVPHVESEAVDPSAPSAQSDSPAEVPSRDAAFREAQYLVHYLDYIFPIQFAFYVDTPDQGGRGWLYFLLTRSAPLRNAALTLSAFHQHITSSYRTENQEDELLQYHTKALQELRQVVGRREVGGFADSREEWLEFLACGMFLISFEVFQGGTSNWEPHFNALVSVVRELTPSELEFHPSDPSSADFDFIRGMNTAQRFLLANLLWIDILAPVSTGAAPRLPYHDWIDVDRIDMCRVMGCQNSIMIAIGDLVSVDAKAITMSTEILQARIIELEQQIFDGMKAALDAESEARIASIYVHQFQTNQISDKGVNINALFSNSPVRYCSSCAALHTRIRAQATSARSPRSRPESHRSHRPDAAKCFSTWYTMATMRSRINGSSSRTAVFRRPVAGASQSIRSWIYKLWYSLPNRKTRLEATRSISRSPLECEASHGRYGSMCSSDMIE
ncbi:hypothetical protein ACJZ2D_007416 [Fusarium nematophilum]